MSSPSKLSLSPQASQYFPMGPINEDSPHYISGIEKLHYACCTFNREKDNDILKRVDNRELLHDQFKQILRSGFNCRLSNEEYSAISPLFTVATEEQEEVVDGTEFLLFFYRVRYDYRDKRLKERLKKERKYNDREKIYQENKKKEWESKKYQVEFVNDFTEEDLKKALEKLTEASLKFDKTMPNAPSLDGFEVEALTLGEFREQLRFVWGVVLTPKELSAYVTYFLQQEQEKEKNSSNNYGKLSRSSTSASISIDNITRSTSPITSPSKDSIANTNNFLMIPCAPFLIAFSRMGYLEKERRLKKKRNEMKKYEERLKEKNKDNEISLKRTNISKFTIKFTEEELNSAVKKLKEAAKLYDKTMPSAMSLKTFDLKYISLDEFRDQLKKTFHMNINQAEFCAICSLFETTPDFQLVCEPFLQKFLSMGAFEREKDRENFLINQKKQLKLDEEERKKKASLLEEKNSLKVSYNYTEEEYQSAMHKLTEAAWKYDKTMPGAPNLDAFEAKYMEPHVLKEQLKRAFYMNVTPQELGAIIHFFDPEHKGYIECSVFLKKFFKTGYEERNYRQQMWRELQKKQDQKREEQQKEKMSKLLAKSSSLSEIPDLSSLRKMNSVEDVNTTVATPSNEAQYTQEDVESVFQKLNTASIGYDKTLASAFPLQEFERNLMNPNVFREQLRINFAIKLTEGEFNYITKYFDECNCGFIHCKYFLNYFIRNGIKERYRILKNFKMKQKKTEERKEDLLKMKNHSILLRKINNNINFNYTYSNLINSLNKFLIICQIPSRIIGNNIVKNFNFYTIKAYEFKNLVKNNFLIQYKNEEVGAIIRFFTEVFKEHQEKESLHYKEDSYNEVYYIENISIKCSNFINLYKQIKLKCDMLKGKKNEKLLLQNIRNNLILYFYYKLNPKSYSNFVNQLASSNTGPLPTYITEPSLNLHTIPSTLIPIPSNIDIRPWNISTNSSENQHIRTSLKDAYSMFTHNKSISNSKTFNYPKSSKEKYRLRIMVSRKTRCLDLSSNACTTIQTSESKINNQENEIINEDNIESRDEVEIELTNDEESDIEIEVETQNEVKSVKEEKEAAFLLSEYDDANVQNQIKNHDLESSSESIELPSISKSRKGSVESSSSSIILSPQSNEKNLSNTQPHPSTSSDPSKPVINFKLLVLPKEIIQLKDLEELWLDNNNIKTIPHTIKNLKKLKKLSLKNNLLTDLPNELSYLSSLTLLNLSNNKLENLPNHFMKLENLTSLFLSNNNFFSFPEVLYQTSHLQFLDISYNKLTELKKDMKKLFNLLILHINNNLIFNKKILKNVVNFTTSVNNSNDIVSPTHSSLLETLDVLMHVSWMEIILDPNELDICHQIISLLHPPSTPSPMNLIQSNDQSSKKTPNSFSFPPSNSSPTRFPSIKSFNIPMNITHSSAVVTPTEEVEFTSLLKSRAAHQLANKLRRKKKSNLF